MPNKIRISCRNCEKQFERYASQIKSTGNNYCSVNCKAAHQFKLTELSRLNEILNNYTPEPNTGCWIWLGEESQKYGYISYKRKRYKAHNFFFKYLKPDQYVSGQPVHHNDKICSGRLCVNPEHMIQMSKSQHMKYHMQGGRND